MKRRTLEDYKAALSKSDIWLHRIQRAELFGKSHKNK